MNFKVCITTSGLGSRLGETTKFLNKSLVAVGNKPILSHLVEKVPVEIPIVVALGYKGELVRDFLSLAYPERIFEFVWVDKFEGPGSGLGYSLLRCRENLSLPFVFWSCDTLVTEPFLPPSENWMGHASGGDPNLYRSLRLEGGQVTEICEKGKSLKGNLYPYIGLAGIHDHEEFWCSMEAGTGKASIEMGESFGLRALLPKGIRPVRFTWFDTGTPDALRQSRESYRRPGDPNILEKPNESIWFVNGHVIKYSADQKFIRSRTARAKVLAGYVPTIEGSTDHMYKYRMVDGEVLSTALTLPLFDRFLEHCLKFWKGLSLSSPEREAFQADCLRFYRDKTYERVKQFYETFQVEDRAETINGESFPTMAELLGQVDWKTVSLGWPGQFHGDLHFENVLYRGKDSQFYFLDWRQDFGGHLERGDVYYDLAKIHHGLIMSHELVLQDLFQVDRDGDRVRFDFNRKNILVECERRFESFVKESGFDFRRVEILTALIFVNIAALHHHPYSLLLYYLGKTRLRNALATKAP